MRPSTAIAGPGPEVAPGREGHSLGGVQRHVGEEPAIGRDAGRTRPLGRADQESRRLVDGPLAGVPPVVGEGQRSVVRARRGDSGPVAGLGEGGLGVARRHRVEARPQRGDLVALAVRRQVVRGGQRVLNERVLLHRREHDPRRELHGGHEVGRAGQDLVGWRVLLVRLGTPVAGPGPCLGAGDDDGPVPPGRHGAPARG